MDYPSDYSKVHYPPTHIPYIAEELPSSSLKNELVKEKHSGPVDARKPTNVGFLVLFGIAIFVWLTLAFYCICHGDLSRLDIKFSRNKTDELKAIVQNVRAASGEIYLACSSAVVFSAILIMLFRRFAGTIVWFVIGLWLSVLVIITIVAWGNYGNSSNDPTNHKNTEDSSEATLIPAIIITVFTIVIALIVYGIRKHIRLVIRLFKEAGKVALSMPFILAQPFVTLVALVMTLFLFVYFFLWIESAAVIRTDYMGEVHYEKNGIMTFAQIYNILVVWWIVQFLIACQQMVIAGATATWYFTRDKTRVTNAITTSYKYMLKYHLGSVALGSLIITTIQVIRFIYKATMKKNARNFIGCLMGCVFTYIQRFITFLTKNAYIEIAIYGDGLIVSGKRAFQVLTNNAIKVATINSVGDFVMVVARLLVTGLAVLVGYLLLQGKPDIVNSGYPLAAIAIISFVIVHAFMLAFEMIVDSVFICFCEDCDINDGVQRPYYMNKEMMVFMNEERQKTLRVGDAVAE